MTWFEALTGFTETTPVAVREQLQLEGETITSLVNQQSYRCGCLEIPTLGELRDDLAICPPPAAGRLQLSELVGDVQALHTNPLNARALFQAASQFNLLEMVNPSVTPEQGIGIYQYDRTQGPACAIACGAGTIYRNYFVQLHRQIGQTADQQLDCLADLGRSLGNPQNQWWRMQNGYAFANEAGLAHIRQHLRSCAAEERDHLRQQLRIGLQWNTQVTLNNCQHLVHQAYCSALPVAYSQHSVELWAEFAQLILEATYEATLTAAALNYTRTGNAKVFLTLVGGGAFGNPSSWIFTALKRALDRFSSWPLDVAIVSYGQSDRKVDVFTKTWNDDAAS